MQHDQGHIDAVIKWWSRHTPITHSMHSLASNRRKWREIVRNACSTRSECYVAQASSTRELPVELVVPGLERLAKFLFNASDSNMIRHDAMTMAIKTPKLAKRIRMMKDCATVREIASFCHLYYS
eukprot:2438311-Amphidinium_carterae.1